MKNVQSKCAGEVTVEGSVPGVQKTLGTLLIAEPESLLRWSLVTYLSQWFEVLQAESPEAAGNMLYEHPADAAIVSDGIPAETREAIETLVRSRNSDALIVRTVTNLPEKLKCDQRACCIDLHTLCIEKPFELADLFKLLSRS